MIPGLQPTDIFGAAKWCNLFLHLTNTYVCENFGRRNCPPLVVGLDDTRIAKANTICVSFTPWWKRDLSNAAKLSVFKSVLVSIPSYGHEPWVTTEITLSLEQVAEMGFLQRVQGVTKKPSPESFQWGALRLFRGLYILKFDKKLHRFIVLYNSIWGGLELCLGGLSPQKPPRGDGTAPNRNIPAALVRPHVQNLPRKISEVSLAGYNHGKADEVVEGPGGVTTSPTLLGPVLVWSEGNFLRC